MDLKTINILIDNINYLESHNKNYNKQQYYKICDIKEILKNEYINQYKTTVLNSGNMFNINNLKTFKIFDCLDKINNTEFNQLKRKAKTLFNKYFKNINFDNENCFISSSDIHGFYFPNCYNINCISFINKKPIILLDN